MARVGSFWKKVGNSITPAFTSGVSLLIKGTDKYINFNSDTGEDGYGLRDNGGVIQMKNENGSWVDIPQSVTGAAETFETVAQNLKAISSTLNYTGDNLTSIAYSNGITKTLNYTGDQITSIVLSGSVPGGINLTKTIAYTGESISSISFS